MNARCRYYFRRALGGSVRPLLFLVMRSLSEHRVHSGIEVWAMADTDDDASLFERVLDALRLVQERDSLRFRRIQRYVRRIIVVDRVDAAHIPDIGACALGMKTVLTIPRSRLAATIVHEATHARVRAAGIPVEPRTLAREEVLCVEEAISFLSKLPDGAGEVERMRALLKSELDSGRPWFER